MRQTSRVFIGLLFLLLFSSSRLGAQSNTTFVFTHVNVIPMNTNVVLSDRNVLIENGMITAIGSPSSLAAPRRARIIDAKGKFLIPALSDMHVHLEGDAWNIMFPAASKFSPDEINFADILFVYVANGITTIDVMSALPEHIVLRDKISRNEIVGPRLILSRMIDAADKAWPPPICTWVRTPEEARAAVIDMHKQGYDRVKVYSFLSKDSYDAIVDEARKLHMPVDGHVPYSTSVEYVLSSGQNMIAHTEEIMKFAKNYSPQEVERLASLTASSNSWITSTLIVSRNFNAMFDNPDAELSKPGIEYLHPMGRGIWNFLYENRYSRIPDSERRKLADGFNFFQKPFTYAFFNKGGKLLIGTDPLMPPTLPGVSLHEELQQLVGAGLSPFDALKVSTTNTYDFLHERNTAGTIEPGKKANLVLLDKNLLENISNTRTIRGVMTQNRWISKQEIDKRLKEIADSYSRLQSSKQSHEGD